MRQWFVCLLLYIAVPSQVLAQTSLVDQVFERMEATEGYVIRVTGEGVQDVYVDLGVEDGARAGDLLTVQGGSETIIHPVTGAKITHALPPKAVLGITRSANDYSVAKVLSGGGVIEGSRVKRFSGVPARFEDLTGQGQSLYRELRDGLTELEWQGSFQGSPERSVDDYQGMLFTLTNDRLNISYGQSWPVLSISHDVTSGQVGNSGNGGGIEGNGFREAQLIATIEQPAIAADFLEYQGGQLLVSGTDSELNLSSIDATGVHQLASMSIPHRNRLLAMQWWRPSLDSPPLLALTTWDGNNIEGMLLMLSGQKLEVVQLNLPFILGAFDLDNDGVREALLGQTFTRKNFFGGIIKSMELSCDGNHCDELRAKEPAMALPSDFSVLGSVIADFTGDGELEYAVIRDQKLTIYRSNGRKVYQSNSRVGAGLSTLNYDLNPSQQFSPRQHVYFDSAPLVVSGHGRTKSSLIFARAAYPKFSLPEAGAAERNQLTSLQYENNRFQQRSITNEMDQPISALTLNSGRLLLLLSGAQSRQINGETSGGRLMSVRLDDSK